MGNNFIGFITSFYDAMRGGRKLVGLSTPEFTFSDLSVAFDLSGIPTAEPAVEFDKDHRRRLHPMFHPDYDLLPGLNNKGQQEWSTVAHLSFVHHKKKMPFSNGTRGPSVVQSRHNNVHFDRPKGALLACHFAALGCLKAPLSDGLNVNKQADSATEYCGETVALRVLVRGLSARLLRAAPFYKESWEGEPRRLAALLASKSAPRGLPPRSPVALATASSEVREKYAGFEVPLWDVAVHVRVGFKFVERGETEDANADEVKRASSLRLCGGDSSNVGWRMCAGIQRALVCRFIFCLLCDWGGAFR